MGEGYHEVAAAITDNHYVQSEVNKKGSLRLFLVPTMKRRGSGEVTIGIGPDVNGTRRFAYYDVCRDWGFVKNSVNNLDAFLEKCIAHGNKICRVVLLGRRQGDGPALGCGKTDSVICLMYVTESEGGDTTDFFTHEELSELQKTTKISLKDCDTYSWLYPIIDNSDELEREILWEACFERTPKMADI